MKETRIKNPATSTNKANMISKSIARQLEMFPGGEGPWRYNKSCAYRSKPTHFSFVDDDFEFAPFPPGEFLVEGFAVGEAYTGLSALTQFTRQPPNPFDLVAYSHLETLPISVVIEDLPPASAPDGVTVPGGDAHGARTDIATSERWIARARRTCINKTILHRGNC